MKHWSLMRDLLIGATGSAAVVILDRLGAFEALLGLPLTTAIGKGFHIPEGPWRLILVALLVLLPAVLIARRLGSVPRKVVPGVLELSGRMRIPHKVGTYDVYYPIDFAKTPHLNVNVKGASQFELVEQRPDGFVVRLRRLLAASVFDNEPCAVIWRAEGLATEGGYEQANRQQTP
jgi:hypothetical protein